MDARESDFNCRAVLKVPGQPAPAASSSMGYFVLFVLSPLDKQVKRSSLSCRDHLDV